jgi:RimJ/RimL family protein N-acetyltransferase
MQIPTLATDRFVLRAFRESDVPALTALHSDPEVVRFIRPNGEPETKPGQAWEYMAVQMGHWLLKGYGKWAMADPKTDELIGRVGYFDAPYDWPGLELGWTMARKVWGKGYATEAARLALDWGFANIDADEIISAIIPGNDRSIRVAERLGQKYARMATIHGADCRIYAVTRDEWHAVKARQPYARP